MLSTYKIIRRNKRTPTIFIQPEEEYLISEETKIENITFKNSHESKTKTMSFYEKVNFFENLSKINKPVKKLSKNLIKPFECKKQAKTDRTFDFKNLMNKWENISKNN